MTFSAPLSIRMPLETKPLSLLLESGSNSMAYSLPRLFALNGPNSKRKTSPFAMPFGYSSYLNPEQLVISQGNLPTAQAQSSKDPCTGKTTSSIVPTLNEVIPFLSFSPPTFFIIFAMSIEISQSAVWLFEVCWKVPQLKPIQVPPLWRIKVRSKWYFLNRKSKMWEAAVLQQFVFPSIGQSRLGSIFPGSVYLIPLWNPEGLATGKQMILYALRCAYPYNRVCGPIYSFPCMPETISTVFFCASSLKDQSSYSQQKYWHRLPSQSSLSLEK